MSTPEFRGMRATTGPGSRGDDCPICLNSMQSEASIVHDSCQMTFHQTCFDSLIADLRTHNDRPICCPWCRARLCPSVCPICGVAQDNPEPLQLTENWAISTNEDILETFLSSGIVPFPPASEQPGLNLFPDQLLTLWQEERLRLTLLQGVQIVEEQGVTLESLGAEDEEEEELADTDTGAAAAEPQETPFPTNAMVHFYTYERQGAILVLHDVVARHMGQLLLTYPRALALLEHAFHRLEEGYQRAMRGEHVENEEKDMIFARDLETVEEGELITDTSIFSVDGERRLRPSLQRE